jgi:hypothetical protein
LLLDDTLEAAGRLFLFARPQAVTLDKTQRVTEEADWSVALGRRDSG